MRICEVACGEKLYGKYQISGGFVIFHGFPPTLGQALTELDLVMWPEC